MKAFFSKLSKAVMLPIALLPAAGIMLGIGGSFTNPAMIEAYNLTWLAEGTILNSILVVLNGAGGIVFDNLPVLFALGLAVGFAKKEKGAAALAALIAYLVMNVVIATLLGLLDYTVWGSDVKLIEGATTSVLGIADTLNMGVFGGIFAGFITAMLHNKFIDAKLPAVLGFFGGPRLIPIVASFVAILYGVLFVFIWPPIGIVLSGFGSGIASIGAVGSLIFGFIERALIPFGLHHVFYLPLWQTPVGGCIDAGQVCGTQTQFFYLLENARLEEFSSTNFMTGKFPFMIFGLPGAAFAMYKAARIENRKLVGGLLFSVAFTALLTGITEPIEFTFLFLAPWLYYGIHVPLAAISFMLMDILNVKIGMTFSGGLIDYTLFGLLPQLTGQNVNALMVILVGIPYFFIYFLVFKFAIEKFNIQTPGRGEDMSLKTRADFEAKKEVGTDSSADIEGMIDALGGDANIVDVDACITRLRVTVKDASLVKDNDFWVNNLKAKGLVIQGNGIQAIYGADAKYHKSAICEVLGLE